MKTYYLFALVPCCTLVQAMDMQGMSGMDMASMPSMQMSHHPAKPQPTAKAQPKTTTKPKIAAKSKASAHPHTTSQATPHTAHDAKTMPAAGMKMDLPPASAAPSDTMNMADRSGMDHQAMEQSSTHPKSMQQPDQGPMDMAGMDMNHDHAMPMPSMPPSNAQARSTDYSQGRDFGMLHPPMMMGNDPLYSLKMKRLEWLHSAEQNQGAYEFEGWWGTDWNRAVLKAEGDFDRHSVSDARTELLWRRPLSAFWNTELGVRQDSGNVQDRTWLALGINGIAPYWLDLDATVYVRDQAQTALIVSADYDWRLTQRLLLQPRIEAQLYGKSDRANNLGSGLSQLQTGLRLRYEFSRQFAPYIGFEATHHYGQTSTLLKQAGERTGSNDVVAGVMLWF